LCNRVCLRLSKTLNSTIQEPNIMSWRRWPGIARVCAAQGRNNFTWFSTLLLNFYSWCCLIFFNFLFSQLVLYVIKYPSLLEIKCFMFYLAFKLIAVVTITNGTHKIRRNCDYCYDIMCNVYIGNTSHSHQSLKLIAQNSLLEQYLWFIWKMHKSSQVVNPIMWKNLPCILLFP
jgi:hypothetical protein